MIALTGLQDIPDFLAELDMAMFELDQGISKQFDTFTKEVFEKLVTTTPQWTGDLASAWNYSIGEPNIAYTPIPNKVENDKRWSSADVFVRGDERAVARAISRAASIKPTWRDVVYFHNPAPIAEAVENLQVMIRPVNLVDQRVAMVQFYVDRYSRGGSW